MWEISSQTLQGCSQASESPGQHGLWSKEGQQIDAELMVDSCLIIGQLMVNQWLIDGQLTGLLMVHQWLINCRSMVS